ncbi:TetR/AcrR family transcriptional regulator [Amycolatopsis panacis]|uniref:TetR/AcrR family transcriptional regulator n=1 Tax=Amycolatopsis panacis TaxID=2340917 RepID=A0A419I1J2_9PSEU|nr:TetR/AcrR family transcriptional regulator [Amycolatopsis panacis]RJQ83585.1 TetR/AcrR family transcriptional regulator [Amycolatopsis panacis]
MTGRPARRGRPPRVRPETILNAVGAKTDGEWTMAGIAAELGVSEPTVYYYFPSRKDLVEELAARVFDEVLLPVNDSGDWEQWLTDFAMRALRIYRQYPFMRDLELSAVATERAGGVQAMENALQVLTAHGFTVQDAVLALVLVLTVVQQCGRAENGDAEAEREARAKTRQLATIAEKAGAGLAASAYANSETWDLEATMRRLLRVTLAGIKAELVSRPGAEPGAAGGR